MNGTGRYAVAAAAVALFGACGRDAGDVASHPDGGSDYGAYGPVAGASASATATGDAAAPPRGGGADAAGALIPDPFVGQWNPIPGLPTTCALRVAANAAASVPSLGWMPCASGRTGCRRMVRDWSPKGLEAVMFFFQETIRPVNGKNYLIYERNYVDPQTINPDDMMYVVQEVDGPVVSAVGEPLSKSTTCFVTSRFGEMGIGFHFLWGGCATPSHALAIAPWSAPASLAVTPVSTAQLGLSPGCTAPQVKAVSVGTNRMFVETGLSTAVFDPATGSVVLAHAPGSTSAVATDRSRPVADGALVIDNSSTYTGDLLEPDGTMQLLVSPLASAHVTGFTVDRSNPALLVWGESVDNGGYPSFTLYTAPYATTPVTSTRHAVAVVQDAARQGADAMVANAGVVASIYSPTAVQITRLSDGWGWVVPAEPGDQVYKPLWVDDSEVWLSVDDHAQYGASILRIDRASLGAPTLPPGL